MDFQKNVYFCFIDYAKAFDCVAHNTVKNSLRDGNTRPLYLPPEEPACRFLKRWVKWSGIPLFQNFPQFIVIHAVKGFGIVNKAEVDVFLELLLLRWPSECW